MNKWKIINKKKPKNPGELTKILLKNREIKNKKDFLSPQLENVTIEKTGIDLDEAKKAIKRIEIAIKNKEKIVIYGDYDVDGICGTAILWETIYKIYRNVIPYIPNRVDEGYGLSIKGIENLLSENKDMGLIITVDNGIVANDAVAFAKKRGLDVIITDHHVSSRKNPKAYAIVHTTKLCGAGVAYLFSKKIKNQKSKIKDKEDLHLELAALATVADLVPLIGPNRAIVKFGIEALRKTKREGLLALFEEAKIKREEVDVYHIGHIVAPRLNATGRIAHALDSLRLICTKDRNRAKKLAEYLSQTNKDRQVLTQDSAFHADFISKQLTLNQKFIFVQNKDYNQGIIGLVASRLVEAHYKPAVVVSVGQEYSKGSARSISGFNIIEFLRKFNNFLVDAGGHPMAAGFTIQTNRIEEFKKALIKRAEEIIPKNILERIIRIDSEIDFSLVSPDLYSETQKFVPYGMGNPEPVFVSRRVVIEDMSYVGKEKEHLKMKLAQDNIIFDSILFRSKGIKVQIGDKVDVVYSIEKNSWNGRNRLQLKIKDISFNV